MEKMKKFLNSYYFIGLVFGVTVLCWILRTQILAFSIYAIFFLLIVIFDVKRVQMLAIVLAAIINYREDNMYDNIYVFIVFGSLALVLVIYDFIHHKINFNSEILYASLIFLGANVLSFVNANKDTVGLIFAGVVQIIGYCLIFVYFFSNKENDDFKYVPVNCLFMGLAIFLELVFHLLMFSGGAITKRDIDLGWGISNFIAMVVTILIPPTMYLYVENQKRKYVLGAVVLDLVVIFITFSKGAFLTLGIIFIPFAIFIYKYCKDKKSFLKDGGFLLALGIIGLLIITQIDIIWDGFIEYFKEMDERGWFNNESRIILYRRGLEVFKQFPIFGGGSYTGQYYLDHNSNYHNYIIQSLATIGIVGTIAFIYNIFVIIKKSWYNNYYNIAIIFVVAAMMLHGLVDTTWYNPIIMVILYIFLPFLNDKKVEKDLICE